MLAAIQASLPDGGIVFADPGTPYPYSSGFFDFNSTGQRCVTSRAHGALGFALPAAIGAACSAPASKVGAGMGEGSFGFAVGELEAVVRKRLPITFVVFSNASVDWIKASQNRAMAAATFPWISPDRTTPASLRHKA